jgi:hypothetical protein
MFHVENKEYVATERTDSPSYWLSRLVLGSDTGIAFEEHGKLLADTADRLAPEDIKSIDIEANELSGLLEISVGLEGDNEDFIRNKVAGLALRIMQESDIDLDDLVFRGSRIVNGENFAEDLENDPLADLGDVRYTDDEHMYIVFSELSEMMMEYGPPKK